MIYTTEDIAFIEEWINAISKKILNYKDLEERFEVFLDQICII